MGSFFGRILSWGACKILGFNVEIKNKKNLYLHATCVYLCNHQSNVDLFLLGGFYPERTVLIGKRELIWIPFFGFIYWGTGNILINRKDRVSSIQRLKKVKDILLHKRLRVWFFPEGTRNRGKVALLPFKKGAFHLAIEAQIPLVPVIVPPLKNYFDWGKKRITPSTINIEILDPIPTSGLSAANADELIQTTHQKMHSAIHAGSGSNYSATKLRSR